MSFTQQPHLHLHSHSRPTGGRPPHPAAPSLVRRRLLRPCTLAASSQSAMAATSTDERPRLLELDAHSAARAVDPLDCLLLDCDGELRGRARKLGGICIGYAGRRRAAHRGPRHARRRPAASAGVLWTGSRVVPGAPEALRRLRERGKRLLFVTNNASKSRAAYRKKFESLGLDVAVDEARAARPLAGVVPPEHAGFWPGRRQRVWFAPVACSRRSSARHTPQPRTSNRKALARRGTGARCWCWDRRASSRCAARPALQAQSGWLPEAAARTLPPRACERQRLLAPSPLVRRNWTPPGSRGSAGRRGSLPSSRRATK